MLENPERSFPAIHVAGTNGKGSTSAMIAASLTAAGFRVGLYTSPHLVDFTERIRIDGRKMPIHRVADYTRHLRRQIRRSRATFFDATTAIAFRYFADEGVDIAVIETGLGGRWDSTNVITPLVSVITSIGMEHREYLGNTLRKIAFEKAGIIKRGVPLVVGDIGRPAIDVILKRAARLDSKVTPIARSTSIRNSRPDAAGLTADFEAGGKMFRRLRVAAAGGYQAHNARLALQVLRTLGTAAPSFALPVDAIRCGFTSLRELTGFSGRLQLISRDPTILADVAHNPDGMIALARALRELHSGEFRIVFGVMKDKEFGPMLDLLRPLARMFYFVRAATPRSRDPRELSDYCHDRRCPARSAGSVAGGVRMAIDDGQGRDPILVTGSHFVVGEAFRSLGVRV